MAAPPLPAVPAAAVPADVAPYLQGYLTLLDVALTVAAVLALALAGALWLVWSRLRRRQADTAQLHAWQQAYWQLRATAQCPLCGSRMEPDPAPAPAEPARLSPRQPHRGDL